MQNFPPNQNKVFHIWPVSFWFSSEILNQISTKQFENKCLQKNSAKHRKHTITPVFNDQVHCVSFYCMIIVSSNAGKEKQEHLLLVTRFYQTISVILIQ
jgi:hypothetical protein